MRFFSPQLGLCLVALGISCQASYAANVTNQPLHNEITVTATKTQQLVSTVPAAMTIITKEDIAKHEYKTLGEALRTVPGLAFVDTMKSGNGGGSNVSINGMNPNHTLLLLNGARITSDISQVKGTNLNYQIIGLNNVKRIEILKGGASALYGSDAIGGVINIITDATPKEQVLINSEFTNTQGHTGHNIGLTYFTGQQGKLQGSLALAHARTVPVYDAYGSALKYYGNTLPINLSLNYKADKENSFSLNYNYTKEDEKWNTAIFSIVKEPEPSAILKLMNEIAKLPKKAQAPIYPWTFKRIPTLIRVKALMKKGERKGPNTALDPKNFPNLVTGPIPNSVIDNGYYTRDGHTSQFALDYTNTHKNTLSNLKFTWGHFDEYFTSSAMTHFIGANFPNVPMQILGQLPPLIKKVDADWGKVNHDTYMLEGQRIQALNSHHLLTYGFNINHQIGSGTRINTTHLVKNETHTVKGITSSHPIYRATLNTSSLFIQDEWTPSDKWYIVPALRIDFNNKFNTHISPKLGVAYTISPSMKAKLNISEGYATPGITELYEHWTNTPGIGQLFGDPNLKPEVAHNFDISLEKYYKRGLLKALYFNNRVDNLIAAFPNGKSGNDTGYSFQNITKAHLTGLTLSGNYQFAENWCAFANYTLLNDWNISKHTRLGNRARHTINFGTTYTKGTWNLSLWNTMYINYLELPNYGVPIKHNFSLCNILINHDLNNHITLYAGIDNLFGENNSILGLDGRSYRLGARMSF